MVEEMKNKTGIFKNLTIILSSIMCFGAALAGIVLAFLAIAKAKTPQTWMMFWIYLGVAVLFVIWLVIFLAFIGMNKKILVLGIINVILTGVLGGIFFFFWNPDPMHNPGFLEEEIKNKKDNSFDKVLGVSKPE